MEQNQIEIDMEQNRMEFSASSLLSKVYSPVVFTKINRNFGDVSISIRKPNTINQTTRICFVFC